MQNQWTTLYARTLMSLLMHPRAFFATGFAAITNRQASGILLISALFCAASGTFLDPGAASFRVAVIWMANAIGMAAIGTTIGYLATAATTGRRYSFTHLWRVFSLSSGTVLLIAWVPSAFLLTEPWKWWLIGTGMVKGLGMSITRACITVLFAFGGTVMLIYSILPLVHCLRGLVG